MKLKLREVGDNLEMSKEMVFVVETKSLNKLKGRIDHFGTVDEYFSYFEKNVVDIAQRWQIVLKKSKDIESFFKKLIRKQLLTQKDYEQTTDEEKLLIKENRNDLKTFLVHDLLETEHNIMKSFQNSVARNIEKDELFEAI